MARLTAEQGASGWGRRRAVDLEGDENTRGSHGERRMAMRRRREERKEMAAPPRAAPLARAPPGRRWLLPCLRFWMRAARRRFMMQAATVLKMTATLRKQIPPMTPASTGCGSSSGSWVRDGYTSMPAPDGRRSWGTRSAPQSSLQRLEGTTNGMAKPRGAAGGPAPQGAGSGDTRQGSPATQNQSHTRDVHGDERSRSA